MNARQFRESIASPQIAHASKESSNPVYIASIRQVLRRLLISSVETLEPTVRQYRDRHGDTWWHIYNPYTKEASIFASDTEARAYLEKHYIWQKTAHELLRLWPRR